MPRIAELALQADLCYNVGIKYGMAWAVGSSTRPRYKIGACTMDTIPSTSGIYKITCTANKKIYIGSAVNLQQRKRNHFNALQQGKHYNLHLQRAWNKYGEQAFTFEVVEFVLPMSLTAREQYWLNKLKPFGHKGFNSARDAVAFFNGRKHSPETREKQRQAALGKKKSPEAIEKTRQANLGRKRSPEYIESRRQASLGRKSSLETREKISQSKLGKKRSPETIEKMRRDRLGKKLTPETREKISQANLGRKRTPEAIEKTASALRGRKMSPEVREKIGQASRGRKQTPEAIEKHRQAIIGRKHSPETREKMRQAKLGSQRDTKGRFT